MISFPYEFLPYANHKAPLVKFTLSDPLRKKTVIGLGLIDTGYDGELLLSSTKYEELRLASFELPSSSSSIGKTVTGERITMQNSAAILEFEEVGIMMDVEVDTFNDCQDILMGRGFLEKFVATLNGKSKETTLKWIADK